MPTETKPVVVPGKNIKAVTFKAEEVSVEIIADYLIKGSVSSRLALVGDTTIALQRDIKDLLVKDVFKE
jgi:hypothetical protein